MAKNANFRFDFHCKLDFSLKSPVKSIFFKVFSQEQISR